MKLLANKISIEVEDTGGNGTPVLLVMGLGMQLVAWPPAMVQALVDAGYRVIRFDNRDIGLSQHFDALPRPNLLWAGLKHRLGITIKPPYSLHDMAQDALGVLDALGLQHAHIVGASMGGMIAQRIALAASHRVLSLTSIMSSSGARGLPQAEAQVMRALLSRPKGQDTAALTAHGARVFTIIGSPGFATDPQVLRERVGAAIARSYHPAGSERQMVAIAADTTRAEALRSLRCPTLVVHGKADPLVPYAHGQDTAQRIAGAQLVGIDGMGHDFAPGVVTAVLSHMLPFLSKFQHAKPSA
jgi:pimeloyl-ACP methyl ester carboxylesterase